MKTLEDATRLAETLVYIGEYSGCRTVARLTRMDRPLGKMIGNALEVEESIEVLRGGGPADVRALVVALGGEMLHLGGVASTVKTGEQRIREVLDDGSALQTFRRMVELQGGNPAAVDTPKQSLPQALETRTVTAKEAGHIRAVDTKEMGVASLLLGAGRVQKTDRIDPAVGIEMLCEVGDVVALGTPICRLHFNDRSRADKAEERVVQAIEVGQPGAETALFLGRIMGGGHNGD